MEGTGDAENGSDKYPPFLVRLPLHLLQQVAQHRKRSEPSSIVLKNWNRTKQPKSEEEDISGFFHCDDETHELSVRTEELEKSSRPYEIFQMNNNRGLSTGVATHRLTATIHNNSSSLVEELGRRTKQRLEEERSKRREIVVLDDPIAASLPGRRKTKMARLEEPAETAAKEPIVEEPKEGDLEKRSSIVRVMGLPIHATPGMVRRFFSGLVAQRIVILPNPPPTDVFGEDPSLAYNDKFDKSRILLVQFSSPRVAMVAIQRSNEYIVENSDKYAIKLALVSNKIGTYLLEHLSIDGIPKEPFHKTLSNVENKGLPSTLNFLWVIALRDLKIKGVKAKSWIQQSKYPWKKSISNCKQDTTMMKCLCAKLRHQLIEMETHGCFLSLQALDPALISLDPAVRFHELACKRLKREIDNIQNWVNLYGVVAKDDYDQVM